ncbi:phospholipase D-like domain-containing protein [Streptomyces sp. NPDC057950]|uniref:phospholipase D-like domain-containing protein n=1 Tax=Streptomyces sp. NPDC057950 TaxID=3346288 RepID=UPI0036F15C6E
MTGPAKEERIVVDHDSHPPTATGKGRCSSVSAARTGNCPGLPRLLATLYDRLPEDRLAAWENVLQQVTGPDDPFLGRFITAQSAVGLADQLRAIVAARRTEAPALAGTGVALTLATLRAAPHPRPAQPVSGPLSAAVPARLTSGVVQGVIRSADTSLLIASFAAHGAGDVVAEIAEAAKRGVQVDLLLEESTQASAAFTALPPGVSVWHRVASAGVLHAKLIAADRHTALLSSANLTDRALTNNVDQQHRTRGSTA